VRFSFNCLKKSAHWVRKQSVHASGRLRQVLAVVVAFTFAFSPAAQLLLPSSVQAKRMPTPAPTSSSSTDGCNLHSPHGDIKHVIYIQFDNVHFTRDNPNVPSDLEQIPSLLNFLKDNGTLSDNEHTPL